MPQSKDDKKALQNYVHHLLADPIQGHALIARAQKEKPGRPMTGRARQASRVGEALTRQQKDFVKAVVLKEKWSKLSRKEQEHFYKADETDHAINTEIGGCIADAASSSAAPCAAQVPEIPCLKASAAIEVRCKCKRKHCQKTKKEKVGLYTKWLQDVSGFFEKAARQNSFRAIGSEVYQACSDWTRN